MNEAERLDAPDGRIPLAIRIGLFAIHLAIAVYVFESGLGTEQLVEFGLYIAVNIGLIPLVFLAIGLVGKLLDRSFRLENAYYLGLLMALVIKVQPM